MNESRLFKIVYYLLDKGLATAPELSQQFEVSVRTIYRDIDMINNAGIPVFATQGKGGGIHINKDYLQAKTVLSEDEREQIMMALYGLNCIDPQHLNGLLIKMAGLFQTEGSSTSDLKSPVELDFSNWHKTNQGHDTLFTINNAIQNKNLLQFLYYNGDVKQPLRRTVEPLKLTFKNKDWYLYAFCPLRGSYGYFLLDRMRELETGMGTFTRIMPDQMIPFQLFSEDKTVEATVRFDPQAAARVRNEYSEGITEKKDGSLVVTVTQPDEEMLYHYLLSFQDSAELVSPKALRRNMKNLLARMLEKYEKYSG